MKSVGARIKERRQELGWTQDKLASQACISKGFLSDIENDKRNISAENLRIIADVLGLSLDYLMKGGTSPQIKEDIRIPAPLSELAEKEQLTFNQTLALLQMKHQIFAHRTAAQVTENTEFNWRKFYESVKEFI